METSKRLLNDINEYCVRNKRCYSERQLRLKQEEEENRRLEALKKEDELASSMIIMKEAVDENSTSEDSENNSEKTERSLSENNEDEMDLMDDDVLLKKILNRNLASAPSILSPLNDDLINYFTIDKEKKLMEESSTDEIKHQNYEAQIDGSNLAKDAELDFVVFRYFFK